MKVLSTSLLNVRAVPPEKVGAGSLLVAEPLLSESYFNHGVIVLVDHTETDGALGLVMNNPTGHTLDEFLDGADSGTEVEVYCGGPVGTDRMVFMHTLGETVLPGAKQFAPGLYLGGDFDAAIDYVNSGYPVDGVIRFFIGYSGWDAKQLADELSNGVWGVTEAPADLSTLFCGDGDHYWHHFVRHMGTPYRPWRFYPRDLRSN